MSEQKAAPADIYAGQQLRTQRLLKHISQTAIAESLGVTFQQIQKYEKGVSSISAGRLQLICRILGVPIGSFFESRGQGVVVACDQDLVTYPHDAPFLQTKYAFALNTAFLAVEDPAIRSAIIALIEAAAKTCEHRNSEKMTREPLYGFDGIARQDNAH